MFTEKEIMSFNDLELGVYKYTLTNKSKIPYMTIRELASEAHVSTTTIIRMCKKLNCQGFSEFKIRFRIENEDKQEKYLDDDKTVFIEFLKRVDDKDYVKKIDEISKMLEAAKNLIFIGYGNSGAMANYAARYFSSVGKLALHIDNPMYPLYLEAPEESVIIILSVAGTGDLLVERIMELKKNNVTLISITNSSDSIIAKLSDYNLSYYVLHELKKGELPDTSKVDITTQLPVVYLIETLAKKTSNIKNKRKGAAQ